MVIHIDYKIPLLVLLCGFLFGGFIGNACSLIEMERRVIEGEVVIPGEGAFICGRYKYGWELNKKKIDEEREKHDKNGRTKSKN